MNKTNQQDQQDQQEYPAVKPPKWLYAIVYGIAIAILVVIVAIGWGLFVGFNKNPNISNGVVQTVSEGKKFADFNIKLSPDQRIEQVEYEDFRIIVYVKSSTNKQNLIIILSATKGHEIGRFVIGE